LLFPNATTSPDLYQAVKGNANSVKVATSALPAATATYLLNQINPVTGGVMYINGNVLSEARLLSDLNVSSLQLKDAKYIQSATNNNEMNLLPSAVINNSTAILKMNACMKNAFGQGSVSLAGASKTVIGAGADYCGSSDPLPIPELLYDFRESTTTVATGWANQGSGGGSLITSETINLVSTNNNIEGGRSYLNLTQYPLSFTNPNPVNGNGDFYIALGGVVFQDNLDGESFAWTLGTNALYFYRFSGSLNVRLGGNLVCTIPIGIGYHTISMGRISGVFNVLIDGALVYTQSFSNSITMSGTISIGGSTANQSFIRPSALVYSGSSYISDPNPIAGLNRREIVVTKTA